MVKNTPQEVVHELQCDSPPQATGRDGPPLVGEVRHALQIAIGDEERRIPLRDAHPTPDLGYQQADIMIHAGLGPKISGTRQENRISGDG